MSVFLLPPLLYYFFIITLKKRVNLYPPLQGKDQGAPLLNSDLLTIRPLMHMLTITPKPLYK